MFGCSLENIGDINADSDSLDAHMCEAGASNYSEHAFAEVLDLTHDQMDPFKLHFDDPEWNHHINSLKPLGLAILLNTCNLDTQVSFKIRNNMLLAAYFLFVVTVYNCCRNIILTSVPI